MDLLIASFMSRIICVRACVNDQGRLVMLALPL